MHFEWYLAHYTCILLKLWSKVSHIFLLFSLYFRSFNSKYLKLTKMDITRFVTKLSILPLMIALVRLSRRNIQGVQKSGTADFQYSTIPNVVCLGFIGWHIFFWKEWYQDHGIWLGIVLILWSFLETQSF